MEEFVNFIFGKYLKLVLLILGFGFFVNYSYNESGFGYAIIGTGLVFGAVYLSVHEKKDRRL